MADHEIEHGRKLSEWNTEEVWGWGTPAGRERFKRRVEWISRGAGLSPKKRALEIGCGTGLFTEAFAEAGAHLTAVDISAHLLQKAIARKLPSDRVTFLERRFEDCEEVGPFDAVIGSSVLHHLDLNSAFSKILNLLKPGGVMSFAEPNMLNPQVFAERKFRKYFPQVSPDETAFVRWTLKNTLLSEGFEQISITPFDWLHPSTPPGMMGIVRRVGLCLEKIPLLREFSGSLYIQAFRPLK